MYWLLLWMVMMQSTYHQFSGWACGKLASKLRDGQQDLYSGIRTDVVWMNHIPKGGKPIDEYNSAHVLIKNLHNPRRYLIRRENEKIVIEGGDVGDHFVGIWECYKESED